MPVMTLEKLPRYVLRPVPTALYRPGLQKIVTHIAEKHPALFDRLGPHCDSRFLIDPTNMPFVLLLEPRRDNPRISVYRKGDYVQADARIAGSFMRLLRLIDGETDGDALFFSRDLSVGGNTEAVICLRNALDDVDGSIAQDIAGFTGPPGRLGLRLMRRAWGRG